MLTCEEEIIKDDDGNIFINANGKTFIAIIDFLYTGSLPEIGTENRTIPLNIRESGIRKIKISNDEILTLYEDAKNFELTDLTDKLINYSRVAAAISEEKFKKDSGINEELIKEILNSLSFECMLKTGIFNLRLIPKNCITSQVCNKHQCSVYSRYNDIENNKFPDKTINVSTTNICGIYRKLVETELEKMGYKVYFTSNYCSFVCLRSFRNHDRCCSEILHILTFEFYANELYYQRGGILRNQSHYRSEGLFSSAPHNSATGFSSCGPWGNFSSVSQTKNQSTVTPIHKPVAEKATVFGQIYDPNEHGKDSVGGTSDVKK